MAKKKDSKPAAAKVPPKAKASKAKKVAAPPPSSPPPPSLEVLQEEDSMEDVNAPTAALEDLLNSVPVPSEEKKPAWVDEADRQAQERMPEFLKKSHKIAAWGVSDRVLAAQRVERQAGEAGDAEYTTVSRKRFRHEDLDQLLSRTTPLLSANAGSGVLTAPQLLSTIPLPGDTGRSVHWHPSGQLLVVGGNYHLYLFHVAGQYVELLRKIDVMKRGGPGSTTLKGMTLTSSGESALVTGHYAYTPVLVSLHTEVKTPLRFLDARDSSLCRSSRDEVEKSQRYITKIVVPPCAGGGSSSASSTSLVAVASGSVVKLGSLSSGSVNATMVTNQPVSDVQFYGDHELYVASGDRVLLYDVRMSSRFVREHVDKGALKVTAFSVSPKYLAIGSSTGVVSVHHRLPQASSEPSIVKTFSQLTTAIEGVSFGMGSDRQPRVSFFTRGQKAAFRLANMTDFQVVPSFPPVSTRHEFIHSVGFNTGAVPVLSVGEKQRVVNYGI